MQTPDLTEGNITKIKELFPNVITEKEGADGVIEKAVDFELLKQMLSKELVEDDSERYRLDWPGKKASLLKANTPITSTLRPDRDSSVNFNTTENVFIEGDNFEVLKILQESYLGKIKMIYIDPPYNTGKDFVYRDNRTVSKEDYEEEIGVEDEEGGKLFRNTDSNGRFHSDWLSMMFERLTIARDLLKDDGVIFMSIDENELFNLKKITDEIYGENNLISLLSVENNPKGRKNSNYISVNNEYVIIYAKNKENPKTFFKESVLKEDLIKNKDGRYYSNGRRVLVGESSNSSVLDPNSKKNYSVYIKDKEIITRSEKVGEIDDKLIKNGFKRYISFKNGQLIENTYTSEKLKDLFVDDALIIKEDSIYEKDFNVYKRMKSMLANTNDIDVKTETAGRKLEELGIPFDFSKNHVFIEVIMRLIDDKSFVCLDFFAGSCTTAHSVMDLNASDGGNRKFIMVQIPEKTEVDSDAYKAGYKTISEIGMERIRRAGKKITEENAEKLKEREIPLDIGFRVYKTDTTNMKDVYYHPSAVDQKDLFNQVSNIKEDRNPEDLLTQVILDLGLTLDLPIEKKKIKGNDVYFVSNNALVACFDDKIDFGIIDDIAKYEPLKVVFKDGSFKEEQDRTNIETKFKRLSPDTIITVL